MNLEHLSRRELQSLAKSYFIKANYSNARLVEEIKKKQSEMQMSIEVIDSKNTDELVSLKLPTDNDCFQNGSSDKTLEDQREINVDACSVLDSKFDHQIEINGDTHIQMSTSDQKSDCSMQAEILKEVKERLERKKSTDSKHGKYLLCFYLNADLIVNPIAVSTKKMKLNTPKRFDESNTCFQNSIPDFKTIHDKQESMKISIEDHFVNKTHRKKKLLQTVCIFTF